MYLVQKENNKIKGKGWLVKIARRVGLSDGLYSYNEESGKFDRIEHWDIKQEFDKQIKFTVFSNKLIIPKSFQQANHYGLPIESEVETSEDKFSTISCFLYNKQLFSFCDSFEGFDFKLQEAIEKNDVKSLSLEQRYFFHKHFQEIELEKKRSELEKLKTFDGRLKIAIETAGAKYISHFNSSNGTVVEWECDRKIVTLIDDKLKVLHAGFCVSGYDRTQSITSLILLYRSYIEEDEGLIYITRRNE